MLIPATTLFSLCASASLTQPFSLLFWYISSSSWYDGVSDVSLQKRPDHLEWTLNLPSNDIHSNQQTGCAKIIQRHKKSDADGSQRIR
jgi:hypothetical protein